MATVKTAKKKRAVNKKKDEFYVNPARFKELIIQYYESDGMCNPELADIILRIANGLSHMYKFINYTYRDEMVGDAVLKMFSALEKQKFDIKSEYNPFSYFTTIAFHAFINRIKREQKHAKTVSDYQEELFGKLLNDDETSPSHHVYVKPEIDED